jgi:hypothetical protein
MTVRHVVLFDYKPSTPEPTIQAAIARLNALPATIPEILSWKIVEDIGKREGGSYRFALIATFEDLPAVERYLIHADHVAAVEFGAAHVDRVAEHDHVD